MGICVGLSGVRVGIDMYKYLFTYICTCTHIIVCVHVCRAVKRTCGYRYVRVCVHVYMYAKMYNCTRACV